MSTTPVAGTASTAGVSTEPELVIYGHSPLLYWWPVWVAGFLMALWTYADNHHMVLVPEGTTIHGDRLALPADGEAVATGLHVSRSRLPGIIFAVVLLTVVVFGHVWLRGVWSLLFAASVAAAVFLVGWLDWWGPVFRWLGHLRIHINLGGYLVIATVLCVAWFATVYGTDRRVYVVFSPSQVRLRDWLGGEEQVFDTGTVTFEKRPYDWFRWLVGGGAGDMVIRVGGPHAQVIELPNVVGVGRWLNELEERLRTRDVV